MEMEIIRKIISTGSKKLTEYIFGGKTLWHFQIFLDGMRRQRQFLQHVVLLVEQAINNRSVIHLCAAPAISNYSYISDCRGFLNELVI